jgi:hypothetical protein
LYEDYLKGINYLGNVIEGNGDSINKRFYGAIITSYRQLQPYSNIPVSANTNLVFSKQPVIAPTQIRGSRNNR